MVPVVGVQSLIHHYKLLLMPSLLSGKLACCHIFYYAAGSNWAQAITALFSLSRSISIAVAMVLYRFFIGFYKHTNVNYSPLPTNLEMSGGGTPLCNTSNSLDMLPLLFALSKFGLIMVFFYLCDRYAFFNNTICLLHFKFCG